jgi:phage gpG-like protein
MPQPKRFGIKTTGDRKAAQALESIGGRGADARPAWPMVTALMRADTSERFDKQGEGAWPPLAASTVEKKKRLGQNPKIMRVTDALYRSLTVKRGRGALRRGTKTQMRYGTTVYYSRFHQEGQGGVPKRPLVMVDADLEKRIVRALEQYVAKGELPPSS